MNHSTLAVNALIKLYQGHIAKHVMNVQVMLENPMAIHDHTDYIGAIDKEIEHIAHFEDKLAVLNKYFTEQ